MQANPVKLTLTVCHEKVGETEGGMCIILGSVPVKTVGCTKYPLGSLGGRLPPVSRFAPSCFALCTAQLCLKTFDGDFISTQSNSTVSSTIRALAAYFIRATRAAAWHVDHTWTLAVVSALQLLRHRHTALKMAWL